MAAAVEYTRVSVLRHWYYFYTQRREVMYENLDNKDVVKLDMVNVIDCGLWSNQ